MEVRRRRRITRVVVAVTVLSTVSTGIAVGVNATTTAGPGPDGTAVTPVGYRVTPAGAQSRLGDLPLGLQLSPHGDLLVASNDGQGLQSLQAIDPATSTVVQTIPYASPASLFMGLAFSPDGAALYASGGGDEQIHTYAVSGQHLSETAPIALPKTSPTGAAVNMYPSGLAVTPDGTRLVVADHLADAASVIDLASGHVHTVAVGHDPLGVALSADGRTAFIANQGGTSVSVLDLTGAEPTVADTITVGTHPNAIRLDGANHRLFVANGDSDTVSVIDTVTDAVTSTIALAPYPHAPVGANPAALSQSGDGSTLYVAASGANAVDVVDLASESVTGMIPTAWYPTALAGSAGRLFVASAKGLGAGPNNGPGYPNPTSSTPTSPAEYDGSMMVGTLSRLAIPVPTDDLAHDTTQVRHDDGFDAVHATEPGEPAIKHVIYVVQENRTYDQVFGSLGKGNGDPSLNLFGDESAANQRALQSRFTTLDNFYADAEISAQGWNWATAASSNAFSETLWPANYSGRNAPYPSESGDPAIAPNTDPKDAYIWDRLADAGVSFRNYGFYVNQTPSGAVAGDRVLDGHTDHGYLGYDLSCPDNPDTFTPLKSTCGTPRISAWKSEFDSYVAHGDLPAVELVRLPNDHTAGTRPGSPTPRTYVSDNDLALGRLVDAVSHSPYWKSTAIFVTEDDAQNGPDHVDAHRTISQVISPYTQTGDVDSTFYSTASILRSIENIVGLKPMTEFDTYATPLSAAFTARPDDTPYSAVRPADAGNTTNSPTAPMAAVSARQDLSTEDRIDERTFNEAIWQSVKGAGSTMPAAQHHVMTGSTAAGTDG